MAKDSLDRGGRTPLHYAAAEDDLAVVRSLLDQGADPSASDKAGLTPLHFAAQQGSTAAAGLLVERGADVHAVDRYGNEPLWTAVFNAHGRGALVELLLRHGSDPRHVNVAGRTPLDMARVFTGDDPPEWVTALGDD